MGTYKPHPVYVFTVRCYKCNTYGHPKGTKRFKRKGGGFLYVCVDCQNKTKTCEVAKT